MVKVLEIFRTGETECFLSIFMCAFWMISFQVLAGK